MDKEKIEENFYCAKSKGKVTRVINGIKMVPERKWVGLTIEERTDIRRRIQEYTPMDNIKYGEAVQFFTEEALKEKNSV